MCQMYSESFPTVTQVNKMHPSISEYSLWLKNPSLPKPSLSYANLNYANLSSTNLSSADLSYANLGSANLSSADLRSADLSYANLGSANLSTSLISNCIGNMKEIKTLMFDNWIISYTNTNMAIGCQQHLIKDWWNFTDTDIDKMFNGALIWWKKWKPILKRIIKISSATP